MLPVTHFTETLLEAVEDELEVRGRSPTLHHTQPFFISQYWTAKLAAKNGTLAYTAELWLQSYLSHANSPSAFPPPSARQPGKAPNPLLASFGWEDVIYDNEFVAAAEESVKRLSVVAKAEGLLLTDPPALYGNYVDANTPLVDIYGENLPILQALQAKIDPNNVMGLAGGFKF